MKGAQITVPYLPQELIDQIIDYLYDSPRVLAACTLVARAWLPSARHHLFRTITISPFNYAAILDHLRTSSSAIIVHTRKIKVTTFQYALPPHARLVVFRLVRDIAARTTIEYLYIENLPVPLFAQLSLEGGNLARVTELVLWSIWAVSLADIVAVVSAFPQLCRLSLWHDVIESNQAVHPEPRLSPHLQSLTFGGSLMRFVDWVKRQPLPSLQLLHVQQTYGYHLHVQQILHNARPSLTHLHIDAVDLGSLDLTHNTPLCSVALVISPGATPGVILVGLSRLELLPALDTVMLDFSVRPKTRQRSLETFGLPSVDAVLVRLPVLRVVPVVLSVARAVVEENRVRVRRLLKECDARGMIEFPTSEPPYPQGFFV